MKNKTAEYKYPVLDLNSLKVKTERTNDPINAQIRTIVTTEFVYERYKTENIIYMKNLWAGILQRLTKWEVKA